MQRRAVCVSKEELVVVQGDPSRIAATAGYALNSNERHHICVAVLGEFMVGGPPTLVSRAEPTVDEARLLDVLGDPFKGRRLVALLIAKQLGDGILKRLPHRLVEAALPENVSSGAADAARHTDIILDDIGRFESVKGS